MKTPSWLPLLLFAGSGPGLLTRSASAQDSAAPPPGVETPKAELPPLSDAGPSGEKGQPSAKAGAEQAGGASNQAHLFTSAWVEILLWNGAPGLEEDEWPKIEPPTRFNAQFDNTSRKGWRESGGCFAEFDGGEWGGALFHASIGDQQWTRLVDSHIHDLMKFGEDEYLAVGGLSHMLSQGSAYLLTRDVKGAWKARKVFETLAGVPVALGESETDASRFEAVSEKLLVLGVSSPSKPMQAFGITHRGAVLYLGEVPADQLQAPLVFGAVAGPPGPEELVVEPLQGPAPLSLEPEAWLGQPPLLSRVDPLKGEIAWVGFPEPTPEPAFQFLMESSAQQRFQPLTLELLIDEPAPSLPLDSSLETLPPPVLEGAETSPKVTFPEGEGQGIKREELLPPSAELPAPSAEIATEAPVADVVLKLRDGSSFKGAVDPENQLRVRTKFGDIKVPFPQLLRITFQGETQKAQLIFRNGDKLTGEVLGEELNLKSPNGESATELKLIQSIEAAPEKAEPAKRR